MPGWISDPPLLVGVVAIAFMAIVAIAIEILDLDDRQFHSRRLERLHHAAELAGHLGLIFVLGLPLVGGSLDAITAALYVMSGGFVIRSILDIVRVRSGFVPQQPSEQSL